MVTISPVEPFQGSGLPEFHWKGQGLVKLQAFIYLSNQTSLYFFYKASQTLLAEKELKPD